MVPMLVQENYLRLASRNRGEEAPLEHASAAAATLSDMDLVGSDIMVRHRRLKKG